ncbi:hypothetical protein PIB30_020834 [Stylosanthes scabra]|uniref:Uncharacterized protein n=1 Tax=Stylosanthes scabra TaxID=79078 RepID=A0ABU6U8V8_9FABA|nr:hypothetical protein [Stylosanthes scabra]
MGTCMGARSSFIRAKRSCPSSLLGKLGQSGSTVEVGLVQELCRSCGLGCFSPPLGGSWLLESIWACLSDRPKMSHYFRPRVRTLPLRGVVTVGHTPCIRVPESAWNSCCFKCAFELAKAISLNPLVHFSLSETTSSVTTLFVVFFVLAAAAVASFCLGAAIPASRRSHHTCVLTVVLSAASLLPANSLMNMIFGRQIVSSSFLENGGVEDVCMFGSHIFGQVEIGISGSALIVFFFMVRGDVNVKPANVPDDIDLVEDVVLLSKSVIDEEMLESFGSSHAVCGMVSEESMSWSLPTRKRGLILALECFFTFFILPSLFEESFYDFKNYCFKVRSVDGVRPFFENEKGEYQFRLYWYSGLESPKYEFEDLDEIDQEIVTVLSQCCVKTPFNTKNLLTRSPSYIRTDLGSKEVPKNFGNPVSQAPPPGSEIQSSSDRSEFKVPPSPTHPSNSTVDKSKSRKGKSVGYSYGSVYAPDFDAVGFTDEFIMENSRIAMDEASLKSNLEFIMKAGIKAAGISRALQKKLADCPPVSRAEMEPMKEKIAAIEKGKEEAENKLSEMKKSVKESELLKKKAEDEASDLRAKVESLGKDLEKLQVEYDELEDDSIKSNDQIVTNLREQAKVFVPTLKVHLLHPDNYVAGGRIVFYEDLVPASEGPFFEEAKDTPEVEVDDAEKAPPA